MLVFHLLDSFFLSRKHGNVKKFTWFRKLKSAIFHVLKKLRATSCCLNWFNYTPHVNWVIFYSNKVKRKTSFTFLDCSMTLRSNRNHHMMSQKFPFISCWPQANFYKQNVSNVMRNRFWSHDYPELDLKNIYLFNEIDCVFHSVSLQMNTNKM